MSGRRKFNIWIAYSDLFTNLSTFLFIAALGVFASLGSMNNDKEEPQAACVIPEVVEQRLGETGLLAPLGPTVKVGSSCRRYYKIDGYHFRSPSAQLSEFTTETLRMTDGEAQDRICAPLWRTIGLQLFEDRKGRVIFHGVGRADNGWRTQRPECPGKLDVPAVNLLGFASARLASTKIEECYAGINAGNICNDVSRCRYETRDGVLPPASDLCRQILTVRAWNFAERSECLRETAALQADTIRRICQAPGWKFFPEGDFVNSDMSQIARFGETRPALWRRTAATGFAKDAPVAASLDEEAQAVLSSLPAGTVVIEVRLGAE
jgi:hypothetical protein